MQYNVNDKVQIKIKNITMKLNIILNHYYPSFSSQEKYRKFCNKAILQ